MNKIKFKELWNNYPDSAPCDAQFKNQCAIKAGYALAKCGVNTTTLAPSKRHYWFHKNTEGHVLSAEELAAGIQKNTIPGVDKVSEFPGTDFKTKIADKNCVYCALRQTL